jgi:hypothetical protein
MEMKKEFKFFTIFEHKKEELYLRRQHQSGWKFIKVNCLGVYHFMKCQPEDVIYQLDYNQEATSSKGEYIKMFSDCGWDYIQDYAGYSYFCKPAAAMNGDEEIFSDDSSRLAMMERVYKGRLLPLLVIFSSVVIPMFILNLVNRHYAMSVFYGIIIVLYVAIFGYCAFRYYQQKGSLAEL